MHILDAETPLIILGLLCLAASPTTAGALAAGCVMAGPMDPSVDGDLDGILLRAGNLNPAPATGDRARIAPGPSERATPATPEVRQVPAGGETGSSRRTAPAAPNVRQAPAGSETGPKPSKNDEEDHYG